MSYLPAATHVARKPFAPAGFRELAKIASWKVGKFAGLNVRHWYIFRTNSFANLANLKARCRDLWRAFPADGGNEAARAAPAHRRRGLECIFKLTGNHAASARRRMLYPIRPRIGATMAADDAAHARAEGWHREIVGVAGDV